MSIFSTNTLNNKCTASNVKVAECSVSMQEDKKDLLQENLNKSFKSKAYNYSTTNNGYYYYSESNNCDYRSFEYDDCDYTTNDFLE